MRRPPKRGFLLVARRELRWLLHNRVALILIFGVPLFAFVVLSAVFSHPVIRGLGVVVVDEDRSETTRAFVEQVAASPNLSIVERAGDLASAARAIRSGEAMAAVYLPANFERDLKAERRPQIVAFYNQQLLTAAGIASSGLSDSLSAASNSAAAKTAPAAAGVGSLVAETIVLVNPQKNYAQFLLRALLPVIIHVVIAIAAGYAVGSEFRRRSMRTWLACAGGKPIVALAGKLAPLFAIFFFIMLSVVLILEGLFEITFKGSVPMVVAAASLFILGYLALGALLQLLVRDLVTGLGLTGLVVSPAFGYAGVGFPVLAMNAFAQAWSTLLPLRWYMAVLFGQAARGLPLANSAISFAMLAALAVLYCLLALLRLRSIARSATPAPAPVVVAPPATAHGIGGAFAAEWRRVLTTRGAFILLVVAPLIYGIYYPQPYLTQILQKIPIAVVDNDLSELSRGIVQTLDASGAVRVAVRVETLGEAQAAIDRGEVFAAVRIPPWTERDVLKGMTVHIPIYADATYLFIFRIDRERHRHCDRHAVVRARRRRRAHGQQPGQSEACRSEPRRHPPAADLQSSGRLRQLYRSGGLRADPAAAAAHRVRVADECGSDAGLERGVRAGARPRYCASHNLSARARAVFICPAARLRLFCARSSSAPHRPRLGVCSGNQFPGPSGRCLVQAS